jgi:hypothetical protein
LNNSQCTTILAHVHALQIAGTNRRDIHHIDTLTAGKKAIGPSTAQWLDQPLQESSRAASELKHWNIPLIEALKKAQSAWPRTRYPPSP